MMESLGYQASHTPNAGTEEMARKPRHHLSTNVVCQHFQELEDRTNVLEEHVDKAGLVVHVPRDFPAI